MVEAWALFRSGRQGDALARLTSLVGGGDRARVSFELAHMRLSVGDTEGTAARVVDADGSELPAKAALHLASRLQHTRPDAARRVLELVCWDGIEDALVAPALGLALDLGFSDAQRSLMPRFDALARSGGPSVWIIVGVDAALDFARTFKERRAEGARIAHERWLTLEAPAHFAFAHDPLTFARLFHRAFHRSSTSDTPMEHCLPLLLRSGHLRDQSQPTTVPVGSTKIRLDVSAILLAAEIGVLENLDGLFEVSVSEDDAASLRSMAGASKDGLRHLATVRSARTFVAGKLEAGAWRFMPSRALPPEMEEQGPVPPLAASLQALCLAEPEQDACTWAEDRLLSVASDLGGVPRVDVWWVLDRLSAAGRLSRRDHRVKVDALRFAGYGFRLPDVADVVAALAEAPLRDGDLVESDTLEVMRVAYARQWDDVLHLTGKTVEQDPAWGAEWCFATRLATFACDVLPAVWNVPSPPDEVWREAASQWAWRNMTCRRRQGMAFGTVTLDPRGLAAASLFRLVLSVYAVQDADRATTRSRRAAYLEWAFLIVVEPLTRREPELGEALVGQVAEALARDDPPPDRSPGWNDPTVKADAITSMLEPFPQGWRDRILWHPALRDVVGMRMVDQVDLGSGLVFTLEAFLGAVEATFLAGEGHARVVGAGSQARFSSVSEAGHDHAATLSVRVGDVEARLRDDHLLLAHPLEDRRRSAMTRRPDWFDGSCQSLATCIERVVTARGPVERSRALTAHRRRSVPWLTGQLASSIRERSVCGRNMLAAPAPDVLRGYLRLPAGPLPDDDQLDRLDQLVARAAEVLTADLGPFEATRRLSGVPATLPAELSAPTLARIATDGIEEVHAALGGTPMTAAALASVVAGSPVDLGPAVALLADAAARYAKFYVCLLRWIFREAEGRPEWEACDPVERAMLLWAHADAVVGTILAEVGAPDRVVQLLDAGERDDIVRHHRRNAPGSPPRSDFLDPNASLSARLWGVAATTQTLRSVVADAAPSVRPDVVEALRPLVALENEGRWIAFPEVLIAPKIRGTEHGWFSEDPALAVRSLIEVPPPFGTRDAGLMADGVMNKLEGAPTRPDANWTEVWFLDPSRLDRQRRERLDSLLHRRGLDQAFDKGADEVLRTLTYRAGLYACDRDTAAFRSVLRETCGKAVQRLGPSTRVPADLEQALPSSRWFTAVIEAAWVYCSRVSDDLTECMREFATCMDVVLAAWPRGFLPALNLLDGITRGLPIDAAVPVWDLVVDLRGRRGRPSTA